MEHFLKEWAHSETKYIGHPSQLKQTGKHKQTAKTHTLLLLNQMNDQQPP